MATRPTLPYFAPADTLPAPLPTVAEILASETRLSGQYESAVYRVGEHYAVKYGGRVHLQEGENMLFIQQSSNVPVPKVYALFSEAPPGREKKMNFIVMEFIPGKRMDSGWESRSGTERKALVAQLRRHMDELRSIPSPGYYDGVWGAPNREYHFTTHTGGMLEPDPDPKISGPHETEEQWAESMLRHSITLVKDAGLYDEEYIKHVTVYLRRHYYATFKGHPAVFTHANLMPRNVMVRPDGSLVIIDWEVSGWYPSFWEYGTSLLVMSYTPWAEWVYEVLDGYPIELGWMSSFRWRFLSYT